MKGDFVRFNKIGAQLSIEISEEGLKLKIFDYPFLLLKFEIIIEIRLGFSVAIFGWLLPEQHDIYTYNKQSMRNITV